MKKLAAAIALSLGAATSAQAATVVLDFEGIAGSYPWPNTTLVGEYYNGAGPSNKNFGISFSDNSLNICLNTIGTVCSNTSRGGLGDPTSQQGGLFFLTGNASIMNVAAGFDTGFSFFYVSVNQTGSVTVYDDLGGTGNVLASITLRPNAGSCPGYNAGFCPFAPIGVSFAGIAKSVSFAGVANQIVFDDVTFGSENPGNPVPEPGSLALLGLGLGALALRRRLFGTK